VDGMEVKLRIDGIGTLVTELATNSTGKQNVT
jgi:hypothetical protein